MRPEAEQAPVPWRWKVASMAPAEWVPRQDRRAEPDSSRAPKVQEPLQEAPAADGPRTSEPRPESVKPALPRAQALAAGARSARLDRCLYRLMSCACFSLKTRQIQAWWPARDNPRNWQQTRMLFRRSRSSHNPCLPHPGRGINHACGTFWRGQAVPNSLALPGDIRCWTV